MSLAEQQRLLWRLVRGEEEPALAHVHFVSRGALDAAARVAIYRNMYWVRQFEALLDGFPKLEAVLGRQAFGLLARAYLTRHPSRHPSLEWLGERLPDFLRSSGEPGHRELAELAELEWARCKAFLVPDAPTVAATDVRPDAFAAARPCFVPALFLLELREDILARWEAPGAALPPATGRVHVVVWRRQYAVRHVTLSALEARALVRARQGACVSEVCELFNGEPSPEEAALSVLGLWFARGWISRLESPPLFLLKGFSSNEDGT